MTAAPASSAICMAGSEARMRVSSVMRAVPPAKSSGTFRSARMNTRLPRNWPEAAKSESRRNFMPEIVGNPKQGGACSLALVR